MCGHNGQLSPCTGVQVSNRDRRLVFWFTVVARERFEMESGYIASRIRRTFCVRVIIFMALEHQGLTIRSGAGLAAILSMKASLSENISVQPIFQLLICPVIDCTATEATTWGTTKYSPWLTPTRMTWYRNQYFVNADDTSNWQASPCFADPSTLAKSPKTFLAIAECDLLSQEALSYGESLKKNGVDTTIEVYKGATHSVLILAGYVILC